MGYEEDEEADVEEDVADQAGAGPEEPEGGRQEGRLRCEEEGHRSLRSGELESGAGGDLRREEDDPSGGDQEALGLHQGQELNEGRIIKPDDKLKAVLPVAKVDMLKM